MIHHIQQLRSFCHVIQCAGISQAAERLQLSQPSVSLQIQSLERSLGVVLFERRGPRIRPTPEGLTLYELALPLIERIDNLEADFNALRGDLSSGEVNIAAGESTILYLLPPIIERFAETYPGIRIRFHNGPGLQGLKLLRDDHVDFAVGSFRGDPPDDIGYQPIRAYDQYLITPLDHPLARCSRIELADISPYKFIFPPRHLNTFSMVEVAFQQQGLTLDVCLEAGGWEVIKRYVVLGVGISIVSGICLNQGDPLACHSLGRHFPQRTYGLIMRRGKFLSPQARKLIEFMASEQPA